MTNSGRARPLATRGSLMATTPLRCAMRDARPVFAGHRLGNGTPCRSKRHLPDAGFRRCGEPEWNAANAWRMANEVCDAALSRGLAASLSCSCTQGRVLCRSAEAGDVDRLASAHAGEIAMRIRPAHRFSNVAIEQVVGTRNNTPSIDRAQTLKGLCIRAGSWRAWSPRRRLVPWVSAHVPHPLRAVRNVCACSERGRSFMGFGTECPAAMSRPSRCFRHRSSIPFFSC